MEVSGKRGSKTDIKILCHTCEGRGLSVHAAGLCVQCEEHMCNSCFDTHTQFKVCRNHTLAGTNESLVITERDDDLEMCDRHKDELVKFYCPEHEQVGCGDCMILAHKTCKVEYIRDIAKTVNENPEFKALIKAVDTCQRQATEISRSFKSNKADAEKINDKFIKDVEKFSIEIISKINSLKDSIIMKAKAVKSKDIDNQNKLEEENRKLLNEMSRITELFQSQIDQPSKRFTNYVLQKPNVKQLQEAQDELQKKNTIKKYQFKPEVNLERLLNDCDVLGSIQEMKKEEKQTVKEKSQKEKLLAVAPKPRLLKQRQGYCQNLEVDGEYLSYMDDGSRHVGLYVEEKYIRQLYYFEIEIISMGERGAIAIGVVPDDFEVNQQPGMFEDSVGYHVNNGKLYAEGKARRQVESKCSEGDRIGFLYKWNYDQKAEKFVYDTAVTKNGVKIGETTLTNQRYFPHPAISLHSRGEKVKVILNAKIPFRESP